MKFCRKCHSSTLPYLRGVLRRRDECLSHLVDAHLFRGREDRAHRRERRRGHASALCHQLHETSLPPRQGAGTPAAILNDSVLFGRPDVAGSTSSRSDKPIGFSEHGGSELAGRCTHFPREPHQRDGSCPRFLSSWMQRGSLLGTPSACREGPPIDGHAALGASDQAVGAGNFRGITGP